MNLIEFWTLCSMNGIVLEKEQAKQIERFANEIVYWNQKVNLISRRDEENLFVRHIFHSLLPLKYIELPQKARCLDVGTGGGFPGIPIGIARPDLRILLIDSILKKINITEMLAKHTGLRFIETKRARCEDLEKLPKYNQHFDFVFSRAVSTTNNLITWTKNIIQPNAKIILLKGGDLTTEINDCKALYPNYSYNVIDLKVIGNDWFQTENKKLLVCQRNDI